MAVMAGTPEIIELDDDSDESGQIAEERLDFREMDRLLDLEATTWNNGYLNNAGPPDDRSRSPEPFLDFEAFLRDRPFPQMNRSPGPATPTEPPSRYHREHSLERSLTSLASPPLPDLERCTNELLELFPDISHEHLKDLYDIEMRNLRQGSDSNAVISIIIEKILEKGKYPKEKDRLKDLKRKRHDDSDEEELAEIRNAEPEGGWARIGPYHTISRLVLQEEFDSVPAHFIDLKLRDSGQFIKAYQAIETAEREWETSKDPLYQRLKRPRKKTSLSIPADLDRYVDSMAPQGYGIAELKREIAAARRQRKKKDDKTQIQKETDAAEKAKEKQYIARGDVLTCCLCMEEETPTYKIIHCNNNENPHFSCIDCFRDYVKERIGVQEWKLKCYDCSDCEATYARSQRAIALDAKTMETLDRLQQQAEIKLADMKGLASCPFCDFAAICPPIKVDWEFRCENPECEKVSCRKCNRETHAPKSCKEAKEEQGIEERHEIEEARTAALLKKCPGCGRSIIKEGGCNKVRCQCGRYICDVCGKDITKADYNHFGEMTGVLHSKTKCALYDNAPARLEKGVQEAEEKAMKKIREENPDISEEDLKIKFNKEVEIGNVSPFARRMGLPPGAMGGRLPPGFPGGYGPPVMPPGLLPHIPGHGPPPVYYGPGDRYGHPHHMAPQMQFPYPGPQGRPLLPVVPGPPPVGNFGQRRRHAPEVPMQMPGAFPPNDQWARLPGGIADRQFHDMAHAIQGRRRNEGHG